VLAITAFFVKLNVGFAAIGAIGLGLLVELQRDPSRWKQLTLTAIGCLSLLAIACGILHVDLLAYVRGSFEIAKGYNEAMFLPPTGKELYVRAALLVVTVQVVWLIVNFRSMAKDHTCFVAMLLTSAFLFLLFKQAFIRADEHVLEFVAWCSVPVGIMMWTARQRGRLSAAPMVVSLAVAITLGEEHKLRLYYPIERALGFATYLSELPLVREGSDSQPVPEDPYLPQEFASHIGSASVDIMPWEISAVVAKGLDYRPRPVMQSYSAYTGYLDGLNAAFFESSTRPDYLVYAHHCADYRYCNFDETKTRLAILSHYEVAARQPYLLLLKARAEPRKLEVTTGPEGSFAFGKPWKVPSVAGFLVADIHLEFSPLGKLFSVLYQPASVEVVLSAERHRLPAMRAIRPALNAGVIVNRLVEDIDDAEEFFGGGEHLRPITKLKLASTNPFLYQSQVKFTSRIVRIAPN